MKTIRKIAFLAVFALAFFATSCNFGDQASKQTVQYLTFSTEEGGSYGFINAKGEVLFADEFKERPTAIIENTFIVEEGDGYAVYNVSGNKFKIVGNLEDLSSVGGVVDGKLPIVRKNSRIEIVNTSGKTLFTLEPVDNKEISSCEGAYTDGLLVINNEDGKSGAVDGNGNVVIKPKYTYLYSFNEGYAIAGKSKDDYDDITYSVINKKGEVVQKFKNKWEPETYNVKNGMFVVKNSETDKVFFVNMKGETNKCPDKVKSISDYNKKYYVFCNQEWKYGVAEISTHKVVIRPKYDRISVLPWTDSKFLVQDDEDFFILNTKAEKGLDFGDEYEFMLPYEMVGFSGYVAGNDDEEYFFLDKQGNKVKTKDDVYELGDRKMAVWTVSSDYFDVDGCIAEIGKQITSNSLCGITIGASAKQYYTSSISESYYWESRNYFTPDVTEIKGYRYSIDCEDLYTDHYIVRSYYDYNAGYYGQWVYEYTPNNKVMGVVAKVEGDTELWSRLKDDIKSMMKGKGFKLDSSDDDELTFSNSSVKVYFSGTYSYIRITMVGKDDANE